VRVAIPRVHRWLYVAGAVLIGAGLVLLGVAVSADEPTGTAAILAVIFLLCGLIAVWAGLKLRTVVDTMQDSLSQGLAAFSGPQGGGSSAFGTTRVATSGDGALDLSGLMETLSQAGINLDPRLFEQAHVTHDVQTIDVSSDSAAEDALRRNGRRGMAIVDSLQPLVQLGDRTVATVALQITLEGDAAPYAVTTHGFVPQAVAGRVTPGMRVPVFVSPDDRQQVLVDWDRA